MGESLGASGVLIVMPLTQAAQILLVETAVWRLADRHDVINYCRCNDETLSVADLTQRMLREMNEAQFLPMAIIATLRRGPALRIDRLMYLSLVPFTVAGAEWHDGVASWLIAWMRGRAWHQPLKPLTVIVFGMTFKFDSVALATTW